MRPALLTLVQVVETVRTGAENVLERVYYDNDVGAWLLAAGIFLGIAALLIVVRAVVERRLGAAARKTRTDVDDLGVDLVHRTRWYFIFALAAASAAQVLVLPARVVTIGTVVVKIATLFQLARWGLGLIDYGLRRYASRDPAHAGTSKMMVGVAGFLLRTLLFGIIALLALENLGFDITALVAGLGIGGIAVALAVQNLLGDLFAAMSIVVDKPFVVGDFVVVGAEMGTVEHIGLKTTRLRSLSGEQIIMSNTDMLGARIRNMARMYERRVVFVVLVAFDTPRDAVARVPATIRAAIEANEGVRFDRAHLARFGESALEFEAVYYVLSPDYNRYMDIQQAINLTLLSRFAAEGVLFALPARTLHVTGSLAGSAAGAAGVRTEKSAQE
jgi:small-conductance mechanosensitive channel